MYLLVATQRVGIPMLEGTLILYHTLDGLSRHVQENMFLRHYRLDKIGRQDISLQIHG